MINIDDIQDKIDQLIDHKKFEQSFIYARKIRKLHPGISKLGSSPTRFGEILATGRPIICNSGVGDLDKIIKANKVGIIAKDKSKSAMQKAVKELYELISDNETSIRCRNLAESFYSLTSGSKKYSMIYKSLIDPN